MPGAHDLPHYAHTLSFVGRSAMALRSLSFFIAFSSSSDARSLSRFASMHGFALNVAPDLAHFGLIVPCGLQRPVTSVTAEVGAGAPPLEAFKQRVGAWFCSETTRLLRA